MSNKEIVKAKKNIRRNQSRRTRALFSRTQRKKYILDQKNIDKATG